MTRARVTYHCDHCGSTELLREAWSYWSEMEQALRLHPAEFDQHFCEACDGETHTVEIDLDNMPPHTALSFDEAKADAGLKGWTL